MQDKGVRIVVTLDASGIKVQSNGANNPTVIAVLEMGKALIMGRTVGASKAYGTGQAQVTKAPAIHARQVDREVA